MAMPSSVPGSADTGPTRAGRLGVWFVVGATGINCGVAARFWRAVITPVPPFTLDWTPLVYGLIGLVCAATAIHATRSARAVLPSRICCLLVIVDGLVLVGYLVLPLAYVVRAFASL